MKKWLLNGLTTAPIMKSLDVLIIDSDKFSAKEFSSLIKKSFYYALIEEISYKKVTDTVDDIQQQELENRIEKLNKQKT